MLEDLEARILAVPESDEARVAVACLLRLRRMGKSLDEIAAGLEAETGMALDPPAVDRVLRRVTGPVRREDGGDPAFLTGQLGSG